MARLLDGAGVRVARIVHSGKLRAQQTAELLASSLAHGTEPETLDGLNPKDPVKPVVRAVVG